MEIVVRQDRLEVSVSDTKVSNLIRSEEAPGHVGEEVEIRGWVQHRRGSGKVAFLVLRDGSGVLQCVAARGEIDDASFDRLGNLPQESAVAVIGSLRADAR